MTPEVTWSGASLCPPGSCSGGYPEQLVICLPDFPCLMSQHEEQVSTGSMDCNRAPRLGGSWCQGQNRVHHWQQQAKGLLAFSPNPGFLGNPKSTKLQPWTSRILVRGTINPPERNYCPGSQGFPIPEQNVLMGHEINLEGQGYHFYTRETRREQSPADSEDTSYYFWNSYFNFMHVYVCEHRQYLVIQCISYCHS